MIYELKDTAAAANLFYGWEETLIWSCLQGVMGHIYGNDRAKPAAGMALLGDFCFFAGRPDAELVGFKPEGCTQDFIIMVPQNEEWGRLIQGIYGNNAVRVTRYATKKEPGAFDEKYLRQIVDGLPEDYSLQRMNHELFERCRRIRWCQDLVAQYPTYEAYQKSGAGVVICRAGEPVAGASSYSSYLEGIEIEIDTREDFRRKGLASVCGAKLILECLKRGVYPSWDAQNKASLALAEKLGYRFAYEYTAYEIHGWECPDSIKKRRNCL